MYFKYTVGNADSCRQFIVRKAPQSVLKPGILRAHLSSDAEMESDYSNPSTF
jgi:hypothetical protein